MPKVVTCPECSWSKAAPSEVPEVILSVESDLQSHLAAEHDWTWQRAHEHARAWSSQIFPSPFLGDGATLGGGQGASRTASCPRCSWSLRAPTEDVFDITHCSAELEEHLKTAHAESPEDALRISEAWAKPLLLNRRR